jgi:hypothetical protein
MAESIRRMTSEETAWVAGLLEGEGSFSRKKAITTAGRVLYYPQVSCGSTDEDVIEKLARIVGAGRTYYRAREEEQNWKPVWEWYLRKTRLAVELCVAIWPHLSSRRRDQIETMINLWQESHE